MSLRETFWLTCREKRCCYNSLVQLSGRDIYRICSIVGLPAMSFVTGLQVPDDAPPPDAFALDRSPARYRLILSKRPVPVPARSRKASIPQTPPCIFLMKLNNGHALCGLGQLRPLVCRTYPISMQHGILQPVNDGTCSCRSWTLNELDQTRELELQATRQAEQAEYGMLVASWNRRVFQDTSPGTFSLNDFLDFLITAYKSLPET